MQFSIAKYISLGIVGASYKQPRKELAMCQECKTDICVMFDNLVRDYHRDFPSELRDDEERRKKYMPMDVSNTPKSAQTHSGFNDMIQAATGIGYTPGEFMNKLAKKSGFKDHVHSWARGTIPNGLARKIILTCAEDMLRKRGARPEMSLLEAAA